MIPSIDDLRREAKRLRKAHAAGDRAALGRVAAHPPRAPGRALRHGDFLHVVAQENGFESWPRLKFAAETVGLDRAARQKRLKTALFHGQGWAVARLLAETPDLAKGRLDLEIALYHRSAVEAALARDPQAATRRIGPRTPILHLAFSRHVHAAPEKRADMIAIAESLVAHGADVDDACPPEPGSPHRLSALYGALGHANNMLLAEWLLAHGADPNDEESLYHATELGHHDGLKLLMRHGARTRGTNALARMLDFDDLEGARLLLDYGADPNEIVAEHPSGEPVPQIPALHQAARRMRDGRFAKLLLAQGADPGLVWQGHTAHALARIYGNADFAAALAAAGHGAALDPVEQVLADCAEGRVAGRLDPRALSAEDRLILTRIIGFPERLDHAKALVAAGIAPDDPDEMGLTPLHLALWHGLPQPAGWLIGQGADLHHRNAYGGDAVETCIHGWENAPESAEADHIACMRLLLDAGPGPEPHVVRGAGDPDMAAFLEDWLDRGSV